MDCAVESAPDKPTPRDEARQLYKELRSRGETGRPSELTDEVAQKIVQAIAGGSFFAPACVAAGIGANSGWDWIKRGQVDSDAGLSSRYAVFARAIAQAEAQCEANSAAVLARGGDGKFPDWRANAFHLERRFKERWAEPKEQLNQGVTIVITSELAASLADALAVASKTHAAIDVTPQLPVSTEESETSK